MTLQSSIKMNLKINTIAGSVNLLTKTNKDIIDNADDIINKFTKANETFASIKEELIDLTDKHRIDSVEDYFYQTLNSLKALSVTLEDKTNHLKELRDNFKTYQEDIIEDKALLNDEVDENIEDVFDKIQTDDITLITTLKNSFAADFLNELNSLDNQIKKSTAFDDSAVKKNFDLFKKILIDISFDDIILNQTIFNAYITVIESIIRLSKNDD